MISTRTSGRILFAGGCHVNGYPIGESSSFSELTSTALGYSSSQIVRIAPIGLSSPDRLFDYLQLNPPPDITVLQFGNYEVPRPISRHARAILSAGLHLNLAARPSVSSKRPWLSLPPQQVFTPTPAWQGRVLLKHAYATAAQHVTPKLYDAAAVRERLRWLLSHLAPFKVPTIVVLTPLPCADHMARGFRIASASIFHEESARAGVLSLDTANALGYSSRKSSRSFAIYADDRHLNLHGHQLLATTLTRLIESLHSKLAHASEPAKIQLEPILA